MASFTVEIPVLQDIHDKLESLLNRYDSLVAESLETRLTNLESQLRIAEDEIVLDAFKDQQDFNKAQIGFTYFACVIKSLHDRICKLEAAQSAEPEAQETETVSATTTDKSQRRNPPSKN